VPHPNCARLVLLRKGNTGNFSKNILDNRLRKHLEETNGYTDTQYGFRKWKSTIDALKKLNEIVKTKGRKNYTRMLTINVKNAFNSMHWGRILEAVSNK